MGVFEVAALSPREIVLPEVDSALLPVLFDVDKSLQMRCSFLPDFFATSEVNNLILKGFVPRFDLGVDVLFIVIQCKANSVTSDSGHRSRYTEDRTTWTTLYYLLVQ